MALFSVVTVNGARLRTVTLYATSSTPSVIADRAVERLAMPLKGCVQAKVRRPLKRLSRASIFLHLNDQLEHCLGLEDLCAD